MGELRKGFWQLFISLLLGLQSKEVNVSIRGEE